MGKKLKIGENGPFWNIPQPLGPPGLNRWLRRETTSSSGQATCFLEETCSLRRAGCFSPMSTSGPRGWGMSKNGPFCPYLEFLAHFLLKRRETLRIAQRLLLSSSTRLEKIPMLTKFPSFLLSCSFLSVTSQNPTDCTTIDVKQLNLIDKNPHVDK